MSSLNLTPDPILMGVQAGIFLTNMYIVKKLMLDPYMKLRMARDAKTGGSQSAAQALLDKAANMDLVITEKMRDAHKSAATVREKIKSVATAKRTELLAQAETAAKKEQSEIQRAIATNLAEERSKKEQTIQQITAEFIQLATH